MMRAVAQTPRGAGMSVKDRVTTEGSRNVAPAPWRRGGCVANSFGMEVNNSEFEKRRFLDRAGLLDRVRTELAMVSLTMELMQAGQASSPAKVSSFKADWSLSSGLGRRACDMTQDCADAGIRGGGAPGGASTASRGRSAELTDVEGVCGNSSLSSPPRVGDLA